VKKGDEDGVPLTELARGLRKRSWVTLRTLMRAGTSVAREGLGFERLLGRVDEDDAVRAARVMLDQLDGLKGLSMKIGQLLSYMDPSLPPKARRVLARLQFQSRPMAFEEIARVVRHDLGDEPDVLFEDFEREPFAAASIGQVHRASLDGEPVAVKVQYPDIESLVRADLKTIRRLARVPLALGPLDGRGLLEELASQLLTECDYELEAENQRWFCRMFQDVEEISVPRVHIGRSGRRVLTSDLARAADFHTFAREADQAVKNRAAESIYRACFTGIFHHCMYNADPHPGNYLFGDDGHVTLLDFGCVKRFDPDFVDRWRRLAWSILEGDLAEFEEAWAKAGLVRRRRRFDAAHQLEAMRVLYRPMIVEAPFTFTEAFIAEVRDRLVFKNRNKFKVALPPEWLFIQRLQFGLFSVLADLGASVDWGAVFREALGQEARPLYRRELPRES
jgi:predicted unusual protein kinase regulating ubiquinone biosynthesis (AarF/ABC1/UbiB family)